MVGLLLSQWKYNRQVAEVKIQVITLGIQV